MYDRVCVTVVRVCMTALRIGQRGSTLCVREIGTLLFQEPHTRPKAGGTHRKALLARQSKAEGLVATEHGYRRSFDSPRSTYPKLRYLRTNAFYQ